MNAEQKPTSVTWNKMSKKKKVAWLAVNVMGWSKKVDHSDEWHPLSDWNDAMEVVEKMSERSYSFDYKIRGFKGGRHAHFGNWDDSIYMETGQEAACRAAFLSLQEDITPPHAKV